MNPQTEIICNFLPKPPLPAKKIRAIIAEVLAEFSINTYIISISTVSEKEMTDMNQRFYGAVGPTDVLSFKYEADILEGEIFICPAQLKISAQADNLNFSQELIKLTLHGLLHLLGYHHDSPEEQILNESMMAKLMLKYLTPNT